MYSFWQGISVKYQIVWPSDLDRDFLFLIVLYTNILAQIMQYHEVQQYTYEKDFLKTKIEKKKENIRSRQLDKLTLIALLWLKSLKIDDDKMNLFMRLSFKLTLEPKTHIVSYCGHFASFICSSTNALKA